MRTSLVGCVLPAYPPPGGATSAWWPGAFARLDRSVTRTGPSRSARTEQRRLLRPTGLSIEEKLRRGQRLSAQAAALRRSLVRDEPGLDGDAET